MTPVQGDHLARNAAGLERLLKMAEGVSGGLFSPRLEGGWTPAALLCHLAFWDRFVIARWDRYDRDGAFIDLPDAHQDLVNAAGLPLWREVDGDTAELEATEAAAAVCRRIAALSPAAVGEAMSTGRGWLLDRTHHWTPHLDELARHPARPARRP